MFKLKRYFNKNTKKIFIFIAIIILVIAVIQVLNQIVKNKEKQEINNISENYINKTERDLLTHLQIQNNTVIMSRNY